MGFFCTHTSLFSVLIIFGCCCFDFGTATDTITSSQFIKDPETVSSNGGLFTLGFFSPENYTNRYVGMWYMSKSAMVWVANRNQPLRDSSGIVKISEDGNLVVLNGQKQIIWSSNVSYIASNTTCQLLDSGNLVLNDNFTGNIIWQSFQHPSDTHIPSMKLTRNKRIGEKLKFTSWKSLSDPSFGNFYVSLERLDLPEFFIWIETRPYWRSGPWNGRVFTGVPMMNSMYNNGINIVHEGDGTVYSTMTIAYGSNLITFTVINSEGKLFQKLWVDAKKQWQVYFTFQNSYCDVYGICGAFGICNSETSPICNCPRGFEPSNREEWKTQNWTDGCVRRTALLSERMKNGSTDGKEDRFLHIQNVKVPDFAEWSSASEDKCRSQCLENCTCIAYSYDSNIDCMSWYGDLIDIQQYASGGIDLYIRVAYSDLEMEGEVNVKRKRDVTVIITVTVIIGTIFIVTCAFFFWNWLTKPSGLSQVKLQELLTYDFEKIAVATNNFHLSNKLGQGGFGPVYKGMLQDGQEIAVKRLSKASGQGLEEFRNEVVVISKLQHRNLVKLLGCCIEGDEKMLIYEYMPNKSLDAFIFNAPKHQILDWRKRFNIIEGIARGILYLHRDSRLKIIHRDLKASNILLDENLNPKISDFGLAKIWRNEDQANTRRVVGTFGYMSPEYAIEGCFSEKSDVFSFGVLLLEIISGRRNSSFYNDEHSLSLLGFAWKLWNEESIVSLIDPEMSDPNLEKDILRCIHIGLLCVQNLARERPSMSTVISMLNSEIVNLPPPRQPAFIQWQRTLSSESHEECNRLFSNGNVSVTEMQAR